MATKIRLTRMGSVKRPHYRLVVVDSRTRRDGRYIENLGTYNPLPAQAEINLKEDRILHWLDLGAQPSGTAESLIRESGIMEKFSLLASGVGVEELEEKLAAWKSKQPKANEATMGRAEKKAKKKADAKAAVEDAAAEAAKAAAQAAAAEARAAAQAAAAEQAESASAEAAAPDAENAES